MAPEIQVEAATEVDDELVEAFAALVPQLSGSASPPGREHLSQMVASPAVTVLVARVGPAGGDHGREGAIIGTLTLALFRIPTGTRAWIEDVVVDRSVRGRGVGEALTRAAVERARDAGARTVELTSRPSREPANRLYRRLGFLPRPTNVYRLEVDRLGPPAPC